MDNFSDESRKKIKQEIKEEIRIEHPDNFSPEEQNAIAIILEDYSILEDTTEKEPNDETSSKGQLISEIIFSV